jgi:hypothetical protein
MSKPSLLRTCWLPKISKTLTLVELTQTIYDIILSYIILYYCRPFFDIINASSESVVGEIYARQAKLYQTSFIHSRSKGTHVQHFNSTRPQVCKRIIYRYKCQLIYIYIWNRWIYAYSVSEL